MLTASGLISVTQLRVPLTSLILAMYAYIVLIALCYSVIDFKAHIDKIDTCELASFKPSLKLFKSDLYQCREAS